MSEDEGSEHGQADTDPADDGAPPSGAESTREQVATDAETDEDASAGAGAGDVDAAESAPGEGAGADVETEDDPFKQADPVGSTEDSEATEETESDDETTGTAEGTPVSQDIVDRIAEHDEDAATEVQALVERAFELRGHVERIPELEARIEELEARSEELEAERDELKSKLARKQADFKNYKERQKRKRADIKERATEDLVERLVDVRDNLKRALDQDVDDDESIRGGVEMTLKEFDRVLAEENVEEISPEEGGKVDPQRHEVMVRVDSDRPAGTIAEVFKPGYEMAGRVIQAAQVTVSNGANHDSADEDDESDADAGTDGGDDETDPDAADGDEAVPLGGDVDDGTAGGEDAGQASDDDISAALDDE